MLRKVKIALISLISLFVLAIPAAAVAATQTPSIVNNLCNAANTLTINTNNKGDCKGIATNSEKSFNDLIADIINIFSVVVGVVAVIMIIVGGFRYITSGGAAEKVTGAKNTILYGIVGLVIVALAQIVVKFVLGQATTAGT